jgi:hypothetical protein
MKLSELTAQQGGDWESLENKPKPSIKLSDIVKQSALTADKNNPAMQGGANAPALVRARGAVSRLTGKNEALDVLPSVSKGLQNAAWPVSALYPKGASEYQPTTGGGKLVADVGGIANPLLQKGFELGGKVVKAVGKFIPETIKRGAADYLTNNVAPKVHQIFQDAVSKFTPEIEKFARDKKVPESAIQTIKKNGTQSIEQMKNAQGEYSTDAISQRVNQGLAAKDKEVSDAYKAATDSAKQNKIVIPLNRTKRTMAAILRNHGYIDARGNETAMAQNDLVQNSPLKTLLGYYKGLNPKTDEGLSMVNTYQWNTLRNNLSNLRRQDKSIGVKSVLDALHNDAERSGLKGIKEARALAASNFEAEDKFTNAQGSAKALLKENGLGKYHTMTGEQKRGIKELADYIGDKNLVRDVEKTSAGQYLDKIKEGKDLNGFQSLLNQAIDKKWTYSKQKELENIIGKDNAKKAIQEVVAHRRINTGRKLLTAGGIYETGHKILTGRF